MRLQSLVAALLTGLVTLAGGALECSPPPLAPVPRHGSELYGRMCSVCHGDSGEGYRADQAPALRNPQFLGTVTDVFLRHAISAGRAGTTMSAWSTARGGPLTPADVDALVAFIRTWQPRSRPKLDDGPNAGDPKRGEPIFAKECARCHGPKGTGGPNVSIGNVQLLATASNGFLRYAIQHGRTGTAMPAFEGKLDRAAIEDVVALLRSFQASSTTPIARPAPPPPIPLGPVPLNPKGPEPAGFNVAPATTHAEVIKAQLDRHARMALLDARAPSDFRNEHITGAVSVPFYDPDPYFDGLPKDAWLVCYCACPHAESGQLAHKLLAKGFKKVTILDEGLGFWKSKGFGTQTGDAP